MVGREREVRERDWGALYIFGKLEGVVIMWAHLPKHPFLFDLCMPFQGLIYW
jgi:hypothetical protein